MDSVYEIYDRIDHDIGFMWGFKSKVVYGFVLSCIHKDEEKYIEASKRTADFFLCEAIIKLRGNDYWIW